MPLVAFHHTPPSTPIQVLVVLLKSYLKWWKFSQLWIVEWIALQALNNDRFVANFKPAPQTISRYRISKLLAKIIFGGLFKKFCWRDFKLAVLELYGEKPMLVVQMDLQWCKLIWRSLCDCQIAKLKSVNIFLIIMVYFDLPMYQFFPQLYCMGQISPYTYNFIVALLSKSSWQV